MISRSDILDLTVPEQAAEALRLARSAKDQLNDMSAQSKVLARVMVTHFEAYEAEIQRLNSFILSAVDAQAELTKRGAEINRLNAVIADNIKTSQEDKREIRRLENELKAIDRQRRQERETW
jgi:hypothetical protein